MSPGLSCPLRASLRCVLTHARALRAAAIVRLFWRGLTPFGFTYRATCSLTGEVDTKMQDALMKKARRCRAAPRIPPRAWPLTARSPPVQVYKAVRGYEREAVPLLIVALLLHLPYFITLRYVG